jgi:HEAT repeat protein
MGLFSRKKDIGELKEGRDFEGLAKVIRSDEDQREAAADALIELGDPGAVIPLTEIMWQLRTGDEDRAAAERVIRELGPEKTFDPLIEAVRQGQLGALRPLVEIGEETVIPRLEEVFASSPGDYEMEHRHGHACDVAQRVLLEFGSPRAMAIFAREIRDGGARREAVGNAFTNWEGAEPEIVKALVAAQADESESVRKFADKAMEKLYTRIRKDEVGFEEPVTAIVELAADRSQPEAVRRQAIGELAEFKYAQNRDLPEPAVNAVVDIVAATDDDEGVRRQAAYVSLELAARGSLKSGNQRAMEILAAAVGDEDKMISWPAACAIGRLGDKRSTPVLCEILTSKEKYYIRRAVTALLETKDPEAYEEARWLGTQGGITDSDLAFKVGLLEGELKKAREKAGITDFDAVDPV